MLKLRSSVKTTLYAVFVLMLAAFATLGALSVFETRALTGHIFVAGASSAAIGGLREVESETDAFLRGEQDVVGDDVALSRLLNNIQEERGALERLAEAIALPGEGRRLREAARSLGSLDERIRAIAASRPMMQAARSRVLNGAARISAQLGEANARAADIALEFEGARKVNEGPFRRAARMNQSLQEIESGLDAIGEEVKAGRLTAALEPERLKRIDRNLGRLRFQTPREARKDQARLDRKFADFLSELRKSAAAGRASKRRRDALLARIRGIDKLADVLRAAAITDMPKAAAGLAQANEIDRQIDWAKLELGRAAIDANTLGHAAERFVEAPSRDNLEALQRSAKAVLVRLKSAAVNAKDFKEIALHSAAAAQAGADIEGALETVLRLTLEAERFRRDADQLVESIESAAIGVVRRIEEDAAARSETAAATLAMAFGCGALAWLGGLFLARNRLLLPFNGLTRAMERLAEGDLTAKSRGAERRDEIGAMARAMEVFREHALEVQKLSAEREEQEVARRAQIEALLQGIKVLNDAETIPEMLEGVLRTLGRLVDYEEAAILVEDGRGRFYAVAATSAGFTPELEPPTPDEAGRDALEELQLLEDCDYRIASRIKGLGYRSALLAPLNAHSRRAMMVCVRREPGVYGEKDLSAVKAFTPIAEQAVRNAEQVDELEGAVRELDAMAHHDTLTGLKNRKSFINVIDQRKKAAEQGDELPFALFHIDLDHFKVINDAIGHAAGDFALSWAAQAIQRCVRRQDVVARLGGDEFAVICDDDFEPGALINIAEKLVHELSQPFDFEGKSLQMGASIGIGRFPADHDDPGQILHIADMALLEAKAGGRGRFAFFSVSLRREMERRQTLEFKLRDAVNNGELELWYQPIVSLKTRQVVSFEALVRWRNPKFGHIPPSDFIPVAERAGLMGRIGEWVIRTACSDLKRWLSEAEGRRIAVNVAGCQLSSPDFVPNLDAIIREVGLPPSTLELELSEEIALRRSAELALDNLMALHERGYQIAFDDFGTGYSSLAHLRRFPGQRMKIDRSFVAGADDGGGAADKALTRGLFVLAKSLGMAVVAEGVETEEQLAFCEEIGCDEVQGFFFGKPAPLTDALLRAERISRDQLNRPVTQAALPSSRG